MDFFVCKCKVRWVDFYKNALVPNFTMVNDDRKQERGRKSMPQSISCYLEKA